MTGFKEGASTSPFDKDDEESEESAETSADVDEEELGRTETWGTAESDEEAAAGPAESGDGETTLPWKFRRSSAREGRVTRQIHLQEETIDREKRFKTLVENRVGEDVPKVDLREAALLVAMDHPDEVAEQLREWGYDY